MRFVSAVCIVSSLVRSVVRIHLIGPIVSVSLICLVIGIMQLVVKEVQALEEDTMKESKH